MVKETTDGNRLFFHVTNERILSIFFRTVPFCVGFLLTIISYVTTNHYIHTVESQSLSLSVNLNVCIHPVQFWRPFI
jgi:hypothetical protein